MKQYSSIQQASRVDDKQINTKNSNTWKGSRKQLSELFAREIGLLTCMESLSSFASLLYCLLGQEHHRYVLFYLVTRSQRNVRNQQ